MEGDESAPDLEGLARFVRTRRLELGLTQEQLAERLLWEQKRISTVETARYGLPSLPLLARLAESLQVPLTDVLRALGYGDLSSPSVQQVQHQSAHCAALLYCLERLLAIGPLGAADLLNEASRVAAEAMGADVVVAYLYDEESRSLRAVGVSSREVAEKMRSLGLDSLPLGGDYVTVAVFETGEPYAAADRGEVARPTTAGIEARSVVAAPIVVGDVRRGVLAAASRQPDRFSADDRTFFIAVAHWVSLALHRTDLLQAAGT